MATAKRSADVSVAILLMCSGVYAGNIQLLGTVNSDLTVGTPGLLEWHWPVLYYLEDSTGSMLFEHFMLPETYPIYRQLIISAVNDAEFATFSNYLTDGVNQTILRGAWNSQVGLVAGGGGTEDQELIRLVPSQGPDLYGYSITHIVQSINIDVDRPGEDFLGDGLWTDWHLSGSYDFYGIPIPEPSSLCLLSLGIFLARLRAKFPNHFQRRTDNCSALHLLCLASVAYSALSAMHGEDVQAQCQTTLSHTIPGIRGGDTNFHQLPNRCLAAPETNVVITIDTMADLGCFAFDAVRDPPVGGQCPSTNCSPIPCCDTDPEDKYVTVSANGHSLNPSILGSTNMPSGGRFFETWNLDCYTNAQACLEAGRSPCDPETPGANRRVVTVPAETWNEWLGTNGNAMTFALSASSAVYYSFPDTESLADYCDSLGFVLCPFQGCSGSCGPSTFTRVAVSYVQCVSVMHCDDSNPCTTDSCTSGLCQYSNNSASCDDGVFCNGADTCSGAACTIHAGDPCDPEYCNESDDQCELIIEGSEPDGRE